MSLLSVLLVSGLALGITSAAVLSLMWDLYLRDRYLLRERFAQEFHQDLQERVQKQGQLFKDLGQPTADAAPRQRVSPPLQRRLQTLVEQSGLKITSQQLCTLAAGMAFVLGILPLFGSYPWFVGAFTAAAGAIAPFMYVQMKRRARLAKLLTQLPEALDLMAGFLAVGQTLTRAMQTIAKKFDMPIAGEFAYCYEQQNLGLPSEIALRDLAERTGLLEYKILVLALLVQQQTGGNLTRLLEKLASVVRERLRLQGHVKAITAEGRMQALLLIVLPPVMFVVMMLVNQQYALVLLEYPRLLLGTMLSMGVGALWIRQIVNFDF